MRIPPLGVLISGVALVVGLALMMLQCHGANAQDAVRQPHGDWSKDASEIDGLLSDRQCDKAWDILLKHIKLGNRQALLKTAGAMGAIHGPGLRLPGAPADAFSSLRFMTIFAALALDKLDSEHAQAARNFLGPLNIFRVPSCGESFDAAECRKAVLERNIAPSLAEFMKEIANYQQVAKTGAFCASSTQH